MAPRVEKDVTASIGSMSAALILAVSLPFLCVSGRDLKQAPAAPAAVNLTQFRRAGCDNFTSDRWEPLRPGYHITIPYGWMNDPHGMFQLNGKTHVFFQYNPLAIKWGAPFWGHVVSDDLARWRWLPPALLPDAEYDFNGCWSGAATVADGQVYLTYTAAGTLVPELGNFFQQQALAVPVDKSDPYLKTWTKLKTNPFIAQVPPGGTNFQFRDPTEARHGAWLALTSPKNPQRLPNSSFALAIGVQSFCMGGGAIYTAPSMIGPWRYQGMLFSQVDLEPEVNGKCQSPIAANGLPGGPAYGGPCNQFGAWCRMWEVVDFLELDAGVFMIKWNDQSRFRALFAMEWYVLGNGDFNWEALNPEPEPDDNPPGPSNSSQVFGVGLSNYPNTTKSSETNGRAMGYNYIDNADDSQLTSLFRGQLDGKFFKPLQMDYGSIYASMVFRTDDSRQVMFSWIYETAAGCKDQCSDQLPEVVRKAGFKGVQTLPRHLTYDPDTKTLRAYPVAETSKLRGKAIPSAANTDRVTSNPITIVPATTITSTNGSITARQMEIHVNFTLSPRQGGAALTEADGGPQPFKATIRLLTGGGTSTDMFLNGTATPAGAGKFTVNHLNVWVDKSKAGKLTNTTWMEGGPVALPVGRSAQLPDNPLRLSIWVDHTVVEVYAMGGLGRVTSRIYPEDDRAGYGVVLLAEQVPEALGVKATSQVWEVNNAWLPPSC